MNKKIILAIFSLVCLLASPVVKAQNADTYFPYPVVPEEINTLSGRCNYLVEHFWERCNLKQSFSSLEKLDKAFGDWLSFMPYATADTVFMSIDKFLADVSKLNGDNQLSIGKMAQKWIYTDTAEYFSEELYKPFCKAMAQSKKVNKAEKARFEAQLVKLENSSLGAKVPDLELTTPSGEKINLRDVVASRVILFFNDPDCLDCSLIKARLAADYNLNTLLEAGLVKLVSIYPDAPTEEWMQEAAKYPEKWVIGASDEIDTYFDLPEMPLLYYLDARHKVLGKNVNIDNLLYGLMQINNQVNPVQ